MRPYSIARLTATAAAICLVCTSVIESQQSDATIRIYNTVKQKLAGGHKVVAVRCRALTPASTAPWRMRALISSGSRCSTAH